MDPHNDFDKHDFAPDDIARATNTAYAALKQELVGANEMKAKFEQSAAEGWAKYRELKAAISCVLKTFTRDEEQGYRGKDRQFAIDILAAALQSSAGSEPLLGRTIHGGNIGGDGIPFYLQPGQCEPEYDQGHSVVVWFDDLYDLDQRARFSDKFKRAENGDVVCVAHGTAIDVHCCHCHSGFIFDLEHECPDAKG